MHFALCSFLLSTGPWYAQCQPVQKTVGSPQVPFSVVPIVMQDRCFVQTVPKIVEFLHAFLEEVVDMPAVVQRQVVLFWGPDVRLTAESPQLQFLDVVVDMPVGVLTGLQLVNKVLAPRLTSCGVDFWGPVQRYRRAVSTGTRPPIIRCIRRAWVLRNTHAITVSEPPPPQPEH